MSEANEQSDAHGSWTISLAFWLALLVAAVAYALVALAPKLLTYVRLRHDHHATQVRLVNLEREASDLQQVVDALERDPDFVRKLASVDFGVQRHGADRILVEEELQLSVRDKNPVLEIPAEALPWYDSVIEPFAVNPRVRGATLLTAAVILIVAFMFLHETPREATSSVEPNRSALSNRYRKPA